LQESAGQGGGGNQRRLCTYTQQQASVSCL